MDAATIVAISATVIAVASLAVSVYQVQAIRTHNRHSVRPLLELDTSFRPGEKAGLLLLNVGLGPARITKTVLTLDGASLGEYNESNVNKVRDTLSIRPAAVTFGREIFLAAEYQQFLLSVQPYDRDTHGEFADLIRRRIGLQIQYESLYGGDRYETAWNST